MKTVLRRKWLWSLFFFICTLSLVILWVDESRAEQKPSVVILPFFVERIEHPSREAVVCPLCKGIYRYGEVFPGSQNILTRLLYGMIEGLNRFKVLPLEKVEEVLSPSVKEQFEKRPLPSAIQIGKGLNVDFILVGYLFRFEERIGSSVGAEKPASVAFDLHLYRLKDEKMVWIVKFDETQRPLSENLFKIGSFFRRKARWLTAEELASVGLDEILKRLPGPKELEEMS
jgi:hypothetical protein